MINYPLSKDDKQYCTLSAIYRMLRKGLINPDDAEALLHTRAKYKPSMAKRIREVWLGAHEIKQVWSIKC